MEILRVENLTKVYGKGENEVRALDGVSFSVEKGEFVAIIGPSGSGKSTLLHILGAVDEPSSGKVFMDGKDVFKQNEEQLAIFRRRQVGLVYQFYNLIPNLTALENVEIAAQLCSNPIPAAQALDMVGLSGRSRNFPAQLSGGEQQRVAIARALAKNPRLLLCDEPTGALDYVTGKAVLKLLYDLSKERGMTVIIITHNQAIAPMADRIIRIKSGKIRSNEINENVVPIDEIEW